MTITATQPAPCGVTVAEAEAMWAGARGGLVNAERYIIDIIKTRAWVVLGYPSFSLAWADRMKGVKLATEAMKAHVVYAFFDAGKSSRDVYRELAGTGIGPRAVEVLAEKHSLGIPADFATTRVRQHLRAKPSAGKVLRVELGESELAYFKDLCDARGLDAQREAEIAVRARIRQIERAC